MCRSIKTLRAPMAETVTDEDVRAAALQYVRKIAGMRAPSAANTDAFHAAVESVAASTQELLDSLVLRPAPPRASPPTPGPARARS
ncbi:MAG: hypothetical protein JWM02_2988 [Frankiales bacterium]|nr:hypothetical protein [Frankiales bacterium]